MTLNSLILLEGIPATATGPNLVGLACLGVIATGIASVLWCSGIPGLPVAAPPLLGLSSAVTGVVIGWLALGQSLTLVQSGGSLMTLGAIAYGAVVRSGETDRAPALDRARLQDVKA